MFLSSRAGLRVVGPWAPNMVEPICKADFGLCSYAVCDRDITSWDNPHTYCNTGPTVITFRILTHAVNTKKLNCNWWRSLSGGDPWAGARVAHAEIRLCLQSINQPTIQSIKKAHN